MISLETECENIYNNWPKASEIVEDTAGKIFNFFMTQPEIIKNSCLQGYDCRKVSFDFLLCDSEKTHEINRDYRGKDYPADIITFALFADSPLNERFVNEFEINLGEVIISLDKMLEGANEKGIPPEHELMFFISHGILHLLGFDHQSEEEFDFVIKYQKKALESLNIYYDKI